MSSADTTDQGRRGAASSRPPTLILACSLRGRVAAMVAACRELEKRGIHHIKERR